MGDARIPKFGNWDSDGNVPYTKYFENARKGRNEGKMINPNDPEENLDAFPKNEQPVHSPAHKAGPNTEALKPKDERPAIREDGDRPSSSPIRRYGDRTNSGEPHRKASRVSVGSDRSIEQSPLHPHHQAKSSAKGGVSSPSRERRGSSEGNHGIAPKSPGRTRFRTVGRGDETPERSAEVPKFGEWEKDPSSADGYTGIFNQVADERKGGSPKASINSNDSKYYKHGSHSTSTGCSCFSWFKK